MPCYRAAETLQEHIPSLAPARRRGAFFRHLLLNLPRSMARMRPSTAWPPKVDGAYPYLEGRHARILSASWGDGAVKAVSRVFGGVFAVFLGSAGGGVAGGVIGHLLGGGDKNIALNVAIAGILIGAVAMAGFLGWLARGSRDWRMVIGGVLAVAVEAAALAWVIGARAL